MTSEQIKQKYGIELILKEGWCWDGDRTKAEKCFCVAKYDGSYPYECCFENHSSDFFYNFSETNPNSKEPQIGDWGWFWDDKVTNIASFSKLKSIFENNFVSENDYIFQNFSHEKPSFLP